MTVEDIILKKIGLIEEWIMQGVAEKDIAGMLDIGYSSYRKAKKENKDIGAKIKKAINQYKETNEKIRKEQGIAVEKSLYQRCLGYDVDVLKHYKMKRVETDTEGNILLDTAGKPIYGEYLEQVKETQHVPADVGAIKFWLMNMERKSWKSDPEKLGLDAKRVANDTKRTKIVEASAASAKGNEKTLEDILAEAEQEAEKDD